MTGPEHYRKAESLLRKGDTLDIAEAQVHATLALAAATALAARMGYGLGDAAGQAWDGITNPKGGPR